MGRHSVPRPEDSSGEPPENPRQDHPQDRYSPDDHYPADDYGDYEDSDYEDSDYTDAVGVQQPPYPPGPPEPPFRPASPPPPPPSQHNGDWEGGDWQGGHRSKNGRRGVSIGVIAALVTVVVVVAAVILWQFFGNALSDRSNAASARCVDGNESVAVIADPSVADEIGKLAKQFNDTASPVGDRCVAIGVKPADSDQVVNGFIGSWPSNLGERPALWIPGSSVSTARLEAATGAKTVSDSRSLVTSPVVLAVRPELKAALAQQNWGTLPGLQTNPTSLDGLNLPGWGSLRLALPLNDDSDASYLASEAVAAASAPSGAPASAGSGAVSTLMAGQPKLADKNAGTAMDALLKASDPAASPVHAVVTTEQQLFQRGASLPDAKNAVASWLPPGPTAMADYPTALLDGSWLSEEQKSAASEFARFLRKPEQLTELAKAGFRTGGGSPPASDVTSFAPLSAPLSVGDESMRATLANALTTPMAGPTASIMLDQSMTTNEGGRSRLANVVAALNSRIGALAPSAAVGLTTFNGTEGSTVVSVGPLSDPVGPEPRSQALTSSLNDLSSSSGGAVSFTTLRAVLNDAVSNFRPGQSNSVLVITSGPHTDKTLDGAGLQDMVRQTADPNRPVAINVIDFAGDPDRATWEAVAQLSGGTYQNLATSNSPELTTAVATLLA
ncbi:MAG: hypothetical protein JWR37_1826 [Mycobacterium sp.]|nr:hypothetical protein [Mycobacterium sp.]